MASIERNNNLTPTVVAIGFRFVNHVNDYLVGSTPRHRIFVFEGQYWLNLPFTIGTASFEEPPQKTPAGTLYQQRLSCSIPGQRTQNFKLIKKMAEMPVVVKITYNNGIEKIMGSPDNPALFISSYRENASKAADVFNFICTSQTRALLNDTEGEQLDFVLMENGSVVLTEEGKPVLMEP